MHVVLHRQIVFGVHSNIDFSEADVIIALSRKERVQPLIKGNRRPTTGCSAGRLRERSGEVDEVREIAALSIVVGKEEDLVALQRPADGGAELLSTFVRLERREKILRLKTVVANVVERLSLELVRPRLGD